MKFRLSIPDRLMKFSVKDVVTECRNWIGCLNNGNYGTILANGKMKLAHRVSYETFVGPIPDGKVVCHKCDNPKCINQDHLFIATQIENVADRNAKNRQAKGDRQGSAKLTQEIVRVIRESPLSLSGISTKYNISRSQAGRIRQRIYWQHVA